MAATVAISSGVVSIVPSVSVRIGWSVFWVIPIFLAGVDHLVEPDRELEAGERAVHRARRGPSQRHGAAAALGVPRLADSPNSHGDDPSIVSFGEKPFSSAAASVITFHVEPAWRPG